MIQKIRFLVVVGQDLRLHRQDDCIVARQVPGIERVSPLAVV